MEERRGTWPFDNGASFPGRAEIRLCDLWEDVGEYVLKIWASFKEPEYHSSFVQYAQEHGWLIKFRKSFGVRLATSA